MIPYEDLCAALDAFAGRTHVPPPARHSDEDTMHGRSAHAPSHYDPPTSDVELPEAPIEGIHSRGHGEDGEEATHVGDLHGNAYEAPAPLEPVFDDKSNELDIGDVLSDEDASK